MGLNNSNNHAGTVSRADGKSISNHRDCPPCNTEGIRLFALQGLPEIHEGDDLSLKIVEAARANNVSFEDGDILVIAQKIVSKAEGRFVRLQDVRTSPRAMEIAAVLKNDPRFIEVVLRESRRIVRQSEHFLIVETHHGFVCANAGVDRSNVPGRDVVTLLPRHPDRSATRFVKSLHRRTGKIIAAIIVDTFGRPWRLGLTNFAIGAAGVPVLADLRGTPDRVGKTLRAAVFAVGDELAAASGLLMGKASGTPVVVVRGYRYHFAHQCASDLIRPAKEDLFR